MAKTNCFTERLIDVLANPNRVSNCIGTAFYLIGITDQDSQISPTYAKWRLSVFPTSRTPLKDGLVAWFTPRRSLIEFPDDSNLPDIGLHRLDHLGVISDPIAMTVHHRRAYGREFIENQPLYDIPLTGRKIVFYRPRLFG